MIVKLLMAKRWSLAIPLLLATLSLWQINGITAATIKEEVELDGNLRCSNNQSGACCVTDKNIPHDHIPFYAAVHILGYRLMDSAKKPADYRQERRVCAGIILDEYSVLVAQSCVSSFIDSIRAIKVVVSSEHKYSLENKINRVFRNDLREANGEWSPKLEYGFEMLRKKQGKRVHRGVFCPNPRFKRHALSKDSPVYEYTHDYAIVNLMKPLNFNDQVKPICLRSKRPVNPNKCLLVRATSPHLNPDMPLAPILLRDRRLPCDPPAARGTYCMKRVKMYHTYEGLSNGYKTSDPREEILRQSDLEQKGAVICAKEMRSREPRGATDTVLADDELNRLNKLVIFDDDDETFDDTTNRVLVKRELDEITPQEVEALVLAFEGSDKVREEKKEFTWQLVGLTSFNQLNTTVFTDVTRLHEDLKELINICRDELEVDLSKTDRDGDEGDDNSDEEDDIDGPKPIVPKKRTSTTSAPVKTSSTKSPTKVLKATNSTKTLKPATNSTKPAKVSPVDLKKPINKNSTSTSQTTTKRPRKVKPGKIKGPKGTNSTRPHEKKGPIILDSLGRHNSTMGNKTSNNPPVGVRPKKPFKKRPTIKPSPDGQHEKNGTSSKDQGS